VHRVQAVLEEEFLPWILLNQLEAVVAVVLLLEIQLYHLVQYGIKTEDLAAVHLIMEIHNKEFLLFQPLIGEWAIYLLQQEILILYKDIMEVLQRILLLEEPLRDLAVAEPDQ
jgi:hypothetical protein